MKESKTKKLNLGKQTISNLTTKELKETKAGLKPCWENLWTLYHCDVIYTCTVPE